MDALQAIQAQRKYVDELLHRITVANSREVRMQLCRETKHEMTVLETMLLSVAAGGTQQ